MKTLFLSFTLAAALVSFSGCADPEPRHTSVTTTSDQTEVHRAPAQSTTVVTQ